MPERKKVSKNPSTPCPDPERYILVRTKKGAFWRRKRGTVKPARLNDVFKQNVNATFVASPAAKRIITALEPYMQGLQTERLVAGISGRLRKALNERGHIDFTYLKGFDFQPDWPLRKRLVYGYTLKQQDRLLKIEIEVDGLTLKRYNRRVTDYYFEAICLYGDATRDRALQVDSVSSPLYSFDSEQKLICVLPISLPGTGDPWMVLLKVSCHEGQELASHPKHYAMAIVRVG
jgi:hypothetical protein